MAHGITTSVRLPVGARKQLERVSRKFNKGKNGIIIEALNDYFHKMRRIALEKEAKTQSLLASGQDIADSAAWEENLDFDDWKS